MFFLSPARLRAGIRALRDRGVPLILLLATTVSACSRSERASPADVASLDSLPVFIGDSLPFEYPAGPYIEGIQDDVTLWMYLDEFGRPVPDSTRIQEHATLPAFDSSALAGSRQLVFRPAYRDGKPVPFPVLFPIKFRVPDGPPMPSDTASPAPKQ